MLRFSEARDIHWVPLKKCISGTGAGFTVAQHHYVRYLAEGVESFERYYKLREPRDAFEVLFEEAPVDYAYKHDGVWRKPWETTEVQIQRDCAIDRNQQWGPISHRKFKREARRLQQLARSISSRGYVANSGEWDAFPIYQLLVDDSSPSAESYRLIISGSHRLAALAYLGWNKVPVKRAPHSPEVRLSDTSKWPGVEKGIFSTQSARHFFHLYFRSHETQLLKGW